VSVFRTSQRELPIYRSEMQLFHSRCLHASPHSYTRTWASEWNVHTDRWILHVDTLPIMIIAVPLNIPQMEMSWFMDSSGK